MRSRRVLSRGLLLAIGWLALMSAPQLADTASAQPVFDHMKCFTIKDSLRGARYSVDLNALDPVNFPPQACTIKVPAKYLCVPTDKSNAVDVKTGGPPPGAAPGANPGDRLCYKVSCDNNKFRTSVQMTDQFGNRNVEARKTQLVCTPATRDGVPTPTPTGAATPTPTAEPTATPTPEPTATPTPTPTPGSVVGAFLDGTTNF